MTLLQKILFTVVFTVYGAIFYGISYYTLAWWDPALVTIPAQLSNEHLLFATAAFTVLVALAYAGAGYVVIGHLPGQSAKDWPPRNRQPLRSARARSGRDSGRARPLQPEVPAGLRASRKDFGRRAGKSSQHDSHGRRPEARGSGGQSS